jgi:hypothetical protein
VDRGGRGVEPRWGVAGPGEACGGTFFARSRWLAFPGDFTSTMSQCAKHASVAAPCVPPAVRADLCRSDIVRRTDRCIGFFARLMLRPPHAVGLMRALDPKWMHASPVVGLALSSGGAKHLVSALYAASDRRLPVGALVRSLFHRNVREESLFSSTNRSLPAAHLSASLTAHVVGIAQTRRPAHEALRSAVCNESGLALPKLARETGVSIARFEKLIELVRAADDVSPEPLPRAGTSLLMSHLWMRSRPLGRHALLTYLTTLHEHYGGVLVHNAVARAHLAPEACFGDSELQPATVESAAHALFDAAVPLASEASASAIELVTAAVALGSERSVPLLQGRYTIADDLPPVADCAELCTRELLNVLLWCPHRQSFDTRRLPPRACAELFSFYDAHGVAHEERSVLSTRVHPTPAPHQTRRVEVGGVALLETFNADGCYTPAAQRWFELVSGMDGVRYLSGEPTRPYEMAPHVDNVLACLGGLLGERLTSPYDLEQLCGARAARWSRKV